MRRARHLMSYELVLLLLLAGWDVSSPTFSSPAGKSPRFQQSAFMTRENTELYVGEPIDRKYSHTISQSEKILVSTLNSAGKKGQQGWAKVQHLYKRYTGVAVPVFGATLQAAYRCKQYSEAAKMYTEIRDMGNVTVGPVLVLYGMKIFGKLQDSSAVNAIWQEVRANGWENKFLTAARIDAASEMGDMEGAASILDFMANETVPAYDIHFNSAINACKNSNHSKRHVAAMFVLDGMLSKGLQPTVVTFANLAGAHRQAPLTMLEGILSRMRDSGITPNKVFAETFVGALFRGRLTAVSTVEDVHIRLNGISKDRLRVAKSVLTDARSRGVRLTKLSSLTDQYLQQLTI
ncbi:PPR10 [Symbiodinium sp. CCMP2456]|nr:PPR10 [Symbiodinium sp. CCMP2456]